MNKILLKFSFSYGNYWDSQVLSVPFTRFADQGPHSRIKGPQARSPFFRITRKIFKFGTCHFKISARNIKAIFRENFSSLRFDSGKIFKIIIFTRGSRTTYRTSLACHNRCVIQISSHKSWLQRFVVNSRN